MLVLGNIIRNMKLVKIRVYKIVYPFFIDLTGSSGANAPEIAPTRHYGITASC